jgi:hypothetical protein
MGGVCTLIGTPPNLIINGLYADKTGTAMNVLVQPSPVCLALPMNVIIFAANIFIVNVVYPFTPLQ